MNRRRAALIGAGVLALTAWPLSRAGLPLVVFHLSESPEGIVSLTPSCLVRKQKACATPIVHGLARAART